MSDETFTQAQVDKIVRERLADMKQQRDTARDEAAKDLEAANAKAAATASSLDAASADLARLDGELAEMREGMGTKLVALEGVLAKAVGRPPLVPPDAPPDPDVAADVDEDARTMAGTEDGRVPALSLASRRRVG